MWIFYDIYEIKNLLGEPLTKDLYMSIVTHFVLINAFWYFGLV